MIEKIEQKIRILTADIEKLKNKTKQESDATMIESFEQSISRKQDELEQQQEQLNKAITNAAQDKYWIELGKTNGVVKQAWDDIMNFNPNIKFNMDAYRIGLRLFKDGLQRSILLHGPTGTGKTTFMRRLGYDLRRPVITVNASVGMKEEDLIGSYVVDKDGPRFVEGPLLIAMRTGAIFGIEEINGATQGVLLKLNSLLDDNQEIYVKEFEKTYKAAPGFIFFGTYNPGYAGTRRLNKAFANRFGMSVEIDTMTEAQLKSALKVKIRDITDAELEICWYVFQGILNSLKLNSLDGAISIRQLINMVLYHRKYNENAAENDEQGDRSWTQPIKMTVAGQVSCGDDDIKNKVMAIAEALRNTMVNGALPKGYIVPGTTAMGGTK